jgi:hypothetical protein
MTSVRVKVGIALLAITVLSCGGGEFTQEELDAAVDEAVSEALAEQPSDTETTSTTTRSTTSTTPPAQASSTSAPSGTTTSVALDATDPRNSDAIEGNGAPPLPVGEPGVVSVINGAFSTDTSFESTRMFFVVRNNTDGPVKAIEVAFTVRDSGGSLLTSGTTSSMYPWYVGPGEISYGSGYIGDMAIPEDAEVESQVSSDPSDGQDSIYQPSIQEHTLQSENVVAIIANNTDVVLTLVSAGVMCFLADGAISWFDTGFADLDPINTGDSSPVTVDMRDAVCPIYLISAYGFED